MGKEGALGGLRSEPRQSSLCDRPLLLHRAPAEGPPQGSKALLNQPHHTHCGSRVVVCFSFPLLLSFTILGKLVSRNQTARRKTRGHPSARQACDNLTLHSPPPGPAPSSPLKERISQARQTPCGSVPLDGLLAGPSCLGL